MKKILFPTDFSEYSPSILKYALELAKAFDATLVPMHVYGDAESASLPKEKQKEMADQLIDVLGDFIKKNKSEAYDDVELEYIVDVGLPENEITDVALDEDIGLIVMGMTGKGNITQNLFGSTALAVISKADCPVLAIPASYAYSKPTQLAYMTDFAFRDIGTLHELTEWATTLDLKIHCIHSVEKNQNEIDAAVNMGMLKKTFASEAITNFEILNGSVVESSNDYLDKNNIGIVAMLSRKRDFIQRLLEESKAKKMAKTLERPILVFKENAYKPVGFPIDFSKFSIA